MRVKYYKHRMGLFKKKNADRWRLLSTHHSFFFFCKPTKQIHKSLQLIRFYVNLILPNFADCFLSYSRHLICSGNM
jgi:hypothetical protein